MKIPDEAIRLNNEGKRYFERGEYDKAIELLAKVLEIAPQYADAYNNLAGSYREKRAFDKAISFSKRAIEMDPKKGVYHTTLGLVYYKMNDLDQCIVSLKKAIELGYNEAEVFEWSEDRRARADHDRYFAAINAKPLIDALTAREGAVQDGGLVGEARSEAIGELRCETDLGNQDERGFSRGEKMLSGLHVDFGFTAAGDAVEQNRMEAGGGCDYRQCAA